MTPDVALCNFEGAKWIFFSEGLNPILYWANFSSFFFSLGLAIFIIYQNRKALPNRILFTILMAFAFLNVMSSLSDVSNRIDVIMTVWAYSILIEPIAYIGGLYLLHFLIDKKDTLSFNIKAILALWYLPIIILAPTKFILSEIETTYCMATEEFMGTYYAYALQVFVVLLIITYGVTKYRETREPQVKKEVLALTTSILLLLVSYSLGNIIGSFTGDWIVGRMGLFGMPIFTASLIYSIVRFKTFNITFLLSVALVLALMMFLFVGLFI